MNELMFKISNKSLFVICLSLTLCVISYNTNIFRNNNADLQHCKNKTEKHFLKYNSNNSVLNFKNKNEFMTFIQMTDKEKLAYCN